MVFHRHKFSLALTAILCLCCLFGGMPAVGAERGDGSEEYHAAVVVSDKIRPYLAALEGIDEVLAENDGIDTDLFFLTDFTEIQLPPLHETISRPAYDLIVSIGPQAARFFEHSESRVNLPPVIHTMMLNPEKILGKDPCGVFLNIPITVQIETMARLLPSLRRIGILYNPAQNGDFVQTATRVAARRDLAIVPLPISSTNDIADRLSENWEKIDALWFIPDRTVISESIIKYLIKEAFVHHVPTIGYNRFFAESGALLSFVIDYTEIGRQTGKLALTVLPGGLCLRQDPVFDIMVNENIGRKLGISLANDGSQPGKNHD